MFPDEEANRSTRVLLAHNYYQQRGGEDECFEAEAELLRLRGHAVETFSRHNDTLRDMGRVQAGARMIWNTEVHAAFREAAARFRPDVIHFHNTFPLLSPAALHAARATGAATVMTLHNYRLSCVNGTLFRAGRVCEACVGQPLAWRGVVHRCYRDSRVHSAGVAGMLALHKTAGTWRRCLDAAIVLTAFARSLGVEDAIPAELLHVKPNFLLEDPGPNFGERSTAFTFVGRLVAEKGLLTLVDAWKGIPWPARLRIVGEGPLASQLATLSSNDSRIELVGRLSTQETLEQMRSARAVIVPSEWHEPFGRVVIEAFATGTPVIAARAGGITELVEDGRTGWLVAPGAPAELARAVSECWQDDTRHRRMQREARRAFETRYTADANYRMLMQVYRSAIVRSRRRIAA